MNADRLSAAASAKLRVVWRAPGCAAIAENARAICGSLSIAKRSTQSSNDLSDRRKRATITCFSKAELMAPAPPISWAINSSQGGVQLLVELQAVIALDAGVFDEATRLLNVIRTREREASERRRRAAEESRADWFAGLQAEAATCALLGRAALAQRDISAAQAQFEEGLRVLAPVDPNSRWAYGFEAALSLYDLGDRPALNEALGAAIHFYKLALADAPRDRVPLDWAATQHALGKSFQTLGERESGTVRLEEAVTAYRAALEEWTRERVPLDWAKAQNNLGIALRTLGERESGTVRLAHWRGFSLL
jgi:tetratricopeptide (TPR) repeat protein